MGWGARRATEGNVFLEPDTCSEDNFRGVVKATLWEGERGMKKPDKKKVTGLRGQSRGLGGGEIV